MPITAKKPKKVVESLRDVVQDVLVPDMKATRVDLTAIRSEMAMSLESMRTEMRLRDEKQGLAIEALSDKLSYAIDIQRLAVLEDRAKR